jgi:hypothetical protein
MSRPEDLLQAKSDVAPESKDPPGQASDQVCQEEIERRRVADAEAARTAHRPEDPLEANLEVAPESQDQPGQTSDQGYREEIEQLRAAYAEAVRIAQARIDQQPDGPAPKLPRAANLRLRQPDPANRRPAASTPPPDDHFAGFEARPPSSHDPEMVAASSEGLRRRVIGPLLTQYAPMVGFAAIVAYAITIFGPFQFDSRWPKTNNDGGVPAGRMSNEPPSDMGQLFRLVIEDEGAFANEPILLGVAVAPPTDAGSLSLRGLAHGTRLSAGSAVGEDSWEFALRDLGGVYVYPPPDFIGVTTAMIALLSPSKKVIDSHPMRLEWLAKADSLRSLSRQEINSGAANAVPKIPIDSGTANAVRKMPIDSGPPSVIAKPEIDSGTVSAAPVRPMDQQEAAALMERGRDLLRNGDVALAQLAFRRLAEAGRADAALALAATYDPRYLAEHKVIGIIGDEAKARAWYQRASELGSTEADRILQRANIK